ncbi:MAG: hypothetical protein FWE13_00195 [Firmicutes bacterium]|nr:hypothetical protein [Bacillota bacterium]
MEQNNKNIEIVIKVIEILAVALIIGYMLFFIFPIIASIFLPALAYTIYPFLGIYTIIVVFLLPCIFVVLFILKIIFRKNLSYDDRKSAIILKIISGILFVTSITFSIITLARSGIMMSTGMFSTTNFTATALWFIGCITAMIAQMYFLSRKEEKE